MAGGGDISGCACLGKPSNSKVFAFIVGNFFFLLTVDYFFPKLDRLCFSQITK